MVWLESNRKINAVEGTKLSGASQELLKLRQFTFPSSIIHPWIGRKVLAGKPHDLHGKIDEVSWFPVEISKQNQPIEAIELFPTAFPSLPCLMPGPGQQPLQPPVPGGSPILGGGNHLLRFFQIVEIAAKNDPQGGVILTGFLLLDSHWILTGLVFVSGDSYWTIPIWRGDLYTLSAMVSAMVKDPQLKRGMILRHENCRDIITAKVSSNSPSCHNEIAGLLTQYTTHPDALGESFFQMNFILMLSTFSLRNSSRYTSKLPETMLLFRVPKRFCIPRNRSWRNPKSLLSMVKPHQIWSNHLKSIKKIQ